MNRSAPSRDESASHYAVGLRARVETWLRHEWQRRGVFAQIARPVSWLFGAIAGTRRALYRLGWLESVAAGIPLIVVGNITVGGTGKTPVVIALVAALRAAGYCPGVISRGYGARVRQPIAVGASSDPAEVGDEPVLIARRSGAPVYVCPNRVAAVHALRRARPDVDVIVSDDGLQHYRLRRDVELVVFDHRLTGNGLLLPAGPLRESRHRRRDLTLVNDPYGHPLPDWPDTFGLTLQAEDAWHLIDPALQRPLAQFRSMPVMAAAGIGAPERFFALLRQHGVHPVTTRELADHHAFADNPFAGDHVAVVLITEKDAVKCAGWHDARLWAVPVHAVLDSRAVALVVEKVRGYSPA